MTDDELAPIDYAVVEFPGGVLGGQGFADLLDLCDRGVVRLLDLEFVRKDDDGRVMVVDPASLENPDGFDLSVWEGATSGLLDRDDLDALSALMGAGSVAVAFVFENRWLLGLVDAWRSSGARLLVDGGVPAEDVIAALDASEG